MGGEVGRIREVLGQGKLITIYYMEKSIFNLRKKDIRLGIRVEFLPDLLGVPYPTQYSLLFVRHNLELPGRWELN